jgi:nucleotide-binding universal stress UspA family protein
MRERLDGTGPERSRIRITANPSPAHALSDRADTEHAGMIIVGSSYTGHLGRVLPGSIGDRLLHGAPCAVAAVPEDVETSALRLAGDRP